MSTRNKSFIHSVKFKLSMPLFILVATVLCIVGFSRYTMVGLEKQIKLVSDVDMPAIAALYRVAAAVNSGYLDERSSLTSKVKSEKYPALVKDHSNKLSEAQSGLDSLTQLLDDDTQIQQVTSAIDNIQVWTKTSFEVIELRSKDNRMNRLLASDLSGGKSRKQFDALNTQLTQMKDDWLASTASQVDSVIISTEKTIGILTLVAVVSAVFGIAVATYLPIRITRRLADIRERILDIAEGDGDLTRRIVNDHKDEIDSIANAFNKFCDNLHDTISQTKESAIAVASSVRQISEGNNSLLGKSERQTAAVLEASSGLTQMSESMAISAENAKSVGLRAETTSSSATTGTEVIEKAVAAMADVSESSGQIADITGLVDSIAFQTNLLALNAAVEAARAGEQGRGFAVVASEVRELAKRSATAASDIKVLSETTNERVKLGTDLVNNSGETLKDIIGSIHEVSTTVNEISIAANEQNQGIRTITHSISEMTNLMQSTSAFVSEVADTSRALEEQAQLLMDSVSRFKLHGDQRVA